MSDMREWQTNSLIADIALDGLYIRLDRDTFVASERGHGGSITGINERVALHHGGRKMGAHNC
jgi:hypothetical protein